MVQACKRASAIKTIAVVAHRLPREVREKAGKSAGVVGEDHRGEGGDRARASIVGIISLSTTPVRFVREQ